MTKPLRRKTLSEHLADRIEEEIRTGVWKNTLPGYRTLAERYSTSRKTCMAAMDILERRRVVETASQGSRRRIKHSMESGDGSAKTTDIPLQRGGLLIISSSVSPISEQGWHFMRLYGDCWIRSGHGVNMAQVDYGRFRNPESLLKSLIENHQAGALLLYIAPKPWVLAAEKLLPVYLAGGERSGTTCAGDGFQLRSEVARALLELRQLGHGRVLMPFEPHLAGFRALTTALMDETFGKSLNRGLIDELCPVFTESVPDAWQEYWRRAFSRTSPSAVILIRDAHVLSLYGYCTKHRIEIPRDLSIIHLGYSQILEWANPAVCQMRYPIRRGLAHFREWIRGGLQPTGMKYCDLEKLPGASVARARKTNP
jgi:hypothetical protein